MRARGERLVLTNGCFDLLHAGHIRYLEEARSLGNALVVAVNGDASARRLKGPGRPINTQHDRASVLAALAAVTFVVVFDEDTAEDLVAQVRPAVYVKGGDYSDDPAETNFPPEGRVVLAAGGTVCVLPLVPDRSTSLLLDRIRS